MKNKIVLTLFAAIVILVLCSNSGGYSNNVTGATGTSGCTPCHGSTSANAVTVELDSAGIAVTRYFPGQSYTVKITGTNGTGTTLPRFGCQVCMVKTTNAGSSTATQAGTWGTLPTGLQQSGGTLKYIQHSTRLSPISGTGANGTVYTEVIPWTAPASGTGSIKLYGVLNAINNNGSDDNGDKYQVATPVTITEAAPAVVASVSISQTSGSNPVCSGTSVTFTATPTNGGTAPTYQWRDGTTNVGTGVTFTSTTLTAGTHAITCVMTSNLSGVTGSPATSNTISLVVNQSIIDSVQISTPNTSVCAGTSVTFTATPFNGGTPTYQWRDGTTNIGTGAILTTSSLTAGTHTITCIMTPTGACVSPATSTSNAITMTINPIVTDSVRISASATALCAGNPVTFTATPFNGGTPTYQWKDGATNIGTGATLTTSALAAGTHAITCVMTPTGSCVSPATSTSNTVTVTVSANVTDSVTIAASATAICSGTSVTFSATPFNAGTNPTYQWYVGATPVATGVSYTTTALVNGDVVSCVMTNSNPCATPATDNSNVIIITVNGAPVTDSVRITASTPTVCAGSPVTFNSQAFNGGTSPTFIWRDGTTQIGTGSSLTISSLSVGTHSITTIMTPSGSCVAPATSTSNAVSITVNATVTPTITISGATSVCSGSADTFRAVITNGGLTPVFSWLVNGNVAGANSSTLILPSVTVVSTVVATLTSSATCPVPAAPSSNTISVSVNPVVTPTIQITTSRDTVCSGSTTTFTAAATGQGTSPSYQWFIGSVPSGTGSSFSTTSLTDGSIVSCVLTSNAPCATSTQVTSNAITMTVNATPLATLVPSGAVSVCTGDTTVLTAGGGGIYQWSSDDSTATVSVTQSGSYTVTVTGANGCTATPAAGATITAHSPTVPNITRVGDTITSSETATHYQWLRNDSILGGADTTQSITLALSGSYKVIVTDAGGCSTSSLAYIFAYTADTSHHDTTHVSIAAIGADLGARLYPVPNKGAFMIDMTDYADAHIAIYDMYGKALYHDVITDAHQEVRDASLVPALYFVRITSHGQTQTIKMQVLKE